MEERRRRVQGKKVGGARGRVSKRPKAMLLLMLLLLLLVLLLLVLMLMLL